MPSGKKFSALDVHLFLRANNPRAVDNSSYRAAVYSFDARTGSMSMCRVVRIINFLHKPK